MFNKIIHKLCQLRNKIIDKDDFNWDNYHNNYSNQLKNSEDEVTQKLKQNEFEVINGKLKFNCNPPLNYNAELLYKVIYDLNPNTIFEVGCGGGDHMYNLLKIMPEKDIKGSDLLPKQLEFLEERSPELKGKTYVNDITLGPVPINELVYTQAVTMHIQKGDRHLDALINMFKASTKYVILMENWERHNYYEDIKNLSIGEDFPWDRLYIYKVDNGKQIAMVLSKDPIKNKELNYVELTSDREMLKYL